MLLRSRKIRSFRVKFSQDSFGYLASSFPEMIDFPFARYAQPFFRTLLDCFAAFAEAQAQPVSRMLGLRDLGQFYGARGDF